MNGMKTNNTQHERNTDVRVKPTLLILLLYKTAVFDILYNFVVLPAFLLLYSCNINELYCPFVTFIKQFEDNLVIEEASKLLLVSFCHIANKMPELTSSYIIRKLKSLHCK